MDHDQALWCCVFGVVVVGAVPAIWGVARMVRSFRRVPAQRKAALDGLQKLLGPQAQLQGSPEHFWVRFGAVEVEVIGKTTSHDTALDPHRAGTQFSPIRASGSVTLRFRWPRGAGPSFALRAHRQNRVPMSLDEAYEITGTDAALVRSWLLQSPLVDHASQVFPVDLGSDGSTVTVTIGAAVLPPERLAGVIRFFDALARAATSAPYGR